MKLSEACDAYIDSVKPYIKPRTLETYQNRKAFWLRTIGDIDTNELTQQYIQDYINDCQEQGQKASAIKVRMEFLILVLKQYQQYQPFKYKRTEADLETKQVYTPDEINAIEQHILKNGKSAYIPIMIAINTGMRVSEISGLKWGDIDFDNKAINVQRNVVRAFGKKIEDTTKTKSGTRTIPMNDTLTEYLRQWKEFLGGQPDCFVCSNNKEPRDVRGSQKTNERLCESLGIEPKGMHAYRHAFATKLLSVSQDYKSVAEIMGHSSIAITQSVYNHPSEQQRKSVIDKAFADDKQPETTELLTAILELTEQIKTLNENLQDL